jgi:transcriptional regulator with XRE-family HTH domain
MTQKNIFQSRRLLDDDAISANLMLVFKLSGMTQADFALQLGIKAQALNGYLHNRDTRKASNLYPKLVELGINGNWYLTGIGPMFMKDLHEIGEGEDRYAKAGRLLYEAIATLLPSQENDIRSTVEKILKASPNCCGTGLDLTEEEYARLIELRQNTAKNQRLTDEHE